MIEQGYSVSFIIPHRGRIEFLKETIASVYALDSSGADIEVIVVTQDSSLNKSDILYNKATNDLTVLHRPQWETISALRNFGVAQSRSDFLAFLDADVKLSKNWLEVMLSELMAPNSGRVIVSAAQQSSANSTVLERIRTALSNFHVDCNLQFLPGRNLFLQRAVFVEIGGFPEHLVTCEDYYFSDRAFQLGRLFYSSRAKYVHLGEDREFSELFRKEIWRAQSNLHSIKGRKIALGEWPSILVPFWLAGFTLIFLICLMRMHFQLSLIVLILVFLPVTLYSMRLFRHASSEAGLLAIFRFYLIYFSARVIGSFLGLFKVLKD